MRHSVIAVVFVALLWQGCTRFVPEVSGFDSTQAHATLLTALDYWKGGKVRQLAKLNPPIRFEDDDHRAGLSLVTYELVNNTEEIRSNRDVPVTLTLKARTGKTLTRAAVYQVSLDPGLAVLRSDP